MIKAWQQLNARESWTNLAPLSSSKPIIIGLVFSLVGGLAIRHWIRSMQKTWTWVSAAWVVMMVADLTASGDDRRTSGQAGWDEPWRSRVLKWCLDKQYAEERPQLSVLAVISLIINVRGNWWMIISISVRTRAWYNDVEPFEHPAAELRKIWQHGKPSAQRSSYIAVFWWAKKKIDRPQKPWRCSWSLAEKPPIKATDAALWGASNTYLTVWSVNIWAE